MHVMCTPTVNRLQIMIDEDLNAELEHAAVEARMSNAALIRHLLRERLNPLPPLSADPIGQMARAVDFGRVATDDVVDQ